MSICHGFLKRTVTDFKVSLESLTFQSLATRILPKATSDTTANFTIIQRLVNMTCTRH